MMYMRYATFLAAAASLLLPLMAVPAELVREFSGRDNTVTPTFHVDGPWTLDWRLDGDFDALIALDITLINARTGQHIGRILHTKRKGNGLKLFHEPGSYQLRVSTTLGRWRVKIEELEPDEVSRYTPKERKDGRPRL
jgi:hypothetical protein